MDNDPLLILFVDGLPHERLSECEYLSTLSGESVTPGFGYSVNQQAMLFSGLTPDDIGVFGEWNYEPSDTTEWLATALSPLDRIRRISPTLDRGVHYLLDRKLGYECANIPFGSLRYFERTGQYPLTDAYDRQTIMDCGEIQTVMYDFADVPYQEKDERAAQTAREKIDSGTRRLLVSLPRVDSTGHVEGMDSPEYRSALRGLDARCRDLVSHFRDRYPGGRVVVCSDHGMAGADETVDLKLDDEFGRPDSDLVYFYDSVYLRAWTDDKATSERLRTYLREADCGRLLLEPDRQRYGLQRPIHGDVVFVLKEGYSFAPNYFGLRPMEAYHGYHPENTSQHGVFLTDGFDVETDPSTLLSAYEFLSENVC